MDEPTEPGYHRTEIKTRHMKFLIAMLGLAIVTLGINQITMTNKAMAEDNSGKNSTKIVIEKFNAAFNHQNVDAVMRLMTEDCVFENTNPAPDGTRIEGAAAVRGYWEKFFTANPGALFESEEMIVSGNRCIVRWIYRKTKDGKPWHLRGVDVFKVRNGKVAEKLAYVKG